MLAAPQSIIDTPRHQMFPVLESADIERVRRFGKVRFYRAGEALVRVGNVSPGLTMAPGEVLNISVLVRCSFMSSYLIDAPCCRAAFRQSAQI